MDFTVNILENFLVKLKKNNFLILRFDEYYGNQHKYLDNEKIVLLRHDVDRFPKTALTLAKMEAKNKIFGTYYFRIKNHVFKKNIIKEINNLGHEIGYHYENLADCKGDFKKAYIDFKENLFKLNDITEIKTVAMHSRPLSKWDNRMFWDKYNLEEFGLLGETYKSINHKKFLYLADSGRNWNSNRTVVWDYVNGIKINKNINGTNDLLNYILTNNIKKIQLLLHPNRWSNNVFFWSFQFLSDKSLNSIKKIILFKKRINKNG